MLPLSYFQAEHKCKMKKVRLNLIVSGAIFGSLSDDGLSPEGGGVSSPTGESYMLYEAVNNHKKEYVEKFPDQYPFTFDLDSRNVRFTDSYQVGQQS